MRTTFASWQILSALPAILFDRPLRGEELDMRPRYFVPVCLYPHTKYRTTEGVAALFQKFQLYRHDYLIVIADRLLALDNLVSGRYWSYDSVYEKARRDAKQIFNLIKRVSYKFKAQDCGRIVYWDDIGEMPQFKEFANRMREGFLADQLLSATLEEFVTCRVNRFGLGSSPERELDYEREYLLSEVCMSVFCTEVLGYWQEIWERPPTPDAPDPIKLLYEDRPEAVVRTTSEPTRRVLRFLDEISPAPAMKTSFAGDPNPQELCDNDPN
jgi:hypothetical protein